MATVVLINKKIQHILVCQRRWLLLFLLSHMMSCWWAKDLQCLYFIDFLGNLNFRNWMKLQISHTVAHVIAAHLEVSELQVTWHLNCNVILTNHTLSKHTHTHTLTCTSVWGCVSGLAVALYCSWFDSTEISARNWRNFWSRLSEFLSDYDSIRYAQH